MQAGFNALSGLKPSVPGGGDYPVVLVQTLHDETSGKFLSRALFSHAPDVEACLSGILFSRTDSSGWVSIEDHPDQKSAMDFAVRVHQAFHTIEYQPLQGMKLYMDLYERFCPGDFRAKPMSSVRRKGR